LYTRYKQFEEAYLLSKPVMCFLVLFCMFSTLISLVAYFVSHLVSFYFLFFELELKHNSLMGLVVNEKCHGQLNHSTAFL
jgi:hypothetical protein